LIIPIKINIILKAIIYFVMSYIKQRNADQTVSQGGRVITETGRRVRIGHIYRLRRGRLGHVYPLRWRYGREGEAKA
jgi:hypothetical protein